MEKEKEKTRPSGHQKLNRKHSLDQTPLSTFMSSKSAEVTHRRYMASPRGSLWAGKVAAKLLQERHEISHCIPELSLV